MLVIELLEVHFKTQTVVQHHVVSQLHDFYLCQSYK